MRRDLSPLVGLPQSAVGSSLQKIIQPSHLEVKPKASFLSSGKEPVPFRYTLDALEPSAALAWAKSYWRNRIGKKHPFVSHTKTDGILQITNNSRIALVGDWGTGTDEAFEVGERVKEFNPNYSIHLGDVYYVGDQDEIDTNFLGIPDGKYDPCKFPSGTEGTFALSGNHEMYARGYAYFDSILPALKQEASYFCLENDNWVIIALDTAYNSIGTPVIENIFKPECQLNSEQLDWLDDLFSVHDFSKKGIIILTHHQYYSSFEDHYPACAEHLLEHIDRPVLWFWGHEHRMAIYDKYSTTGVEAYGRCIGHGGMPILLNAKIKDKKCPLIFTDNDEYPNDEGLKVGYNGYAELIFDGIKLHVDYKDLKGLTKVSEIWFNRNGILGGI